MDAALAAAVPQLRDPAGGEVARVGDERMTANLKTALALASVAAVFFLGIVIRHWIW